MRRLAIAMVFGLGFVLTGCRYNNPQPAYYAAPQGYCQPCAPQCCVPATQQQCLPAQTLSPSPVPASTYGTPGMQTPYVNPGANNYGGTAGATGTTATTVRSTSAR